MECKFSLSGKTKAEKLFLVKMEINICKAIKQHTKEDSQTMVINFPIKTYDLKQNTKLYTRHVSLSLYIQEGYFTKGE